MDSTATLAVPMGDFSSTCRFKWYPDGSCDVLACEKPVFRMRGWEEHGKERQKKEVSPNGDNSVDNVESLERSMRRARARVRDIALCTPFSYFVTLTLDKEKVDRYHIREVTKKMKNWLDNNVRRKGLAYVLVPEHHKDGAIHFHGFFNDALAVVDSGYKDRGGHTIFNLPSWSLGFTTAIALYGEYPQAVAYVCKYIGKEREKIGGRWYYSGGALGTPELVYSDLTVREVEALGDAYTFTPEGSGLGFTMVRLSAEKAALAFGENTPFYNFRTDKSETEALRP